jgi:hypothetical protein
VTEAAGRELKQAIGRSSYDQLEMGGGMPGADGGTVDVRDDE